MVDSHKIQDVAIAFAEFLSDETVHISTWLIVKG